MTANLIYKIISGGQTGADQAGLAAAKHLGLQTGGWMPKGFLTETGPRPDLAALYGLVETTSVGYYIRTERNIHDSDVTLLFGSFGSPGSRLTYRLCYKFEKPVFIYPWVLEVKHPNPLNTRYFHDFLTTHKPRILNVAGNRETKNPGIYDACYALLVKVLDPREP